MGLFVTYREYFESYLASIATALGVHVPLESAKTTFKEHAKALPDDLKTKTMLEEIVYKLPTLSDAIETFQSGMQFKLLPPSKPVVYTQKTTSQSTDKYVNLETVKPKTSNKYANLFETALTKTPEQLKAEQEQKKLDAAKNSTWKPVDTTQNNPQEWVVNKSTNQQVDDATTKTAPKTLFTPKAHPYDSIVRNQLALLNSSITGSTQDAIVEAVITKIEDHIADKTDMHFAKTVGSLEYMSLGNITLMANNGTLGEKISNLVQSLNKESAKEATPEEQNFILDALKAEIKQQAAKIAKSA